MEKGYILLMLLLILFGIIFIIVLMFVVNKISVDLPSFFAKTLPLDMGVFGVYCFTGKQGTGKTYSLTKYIMKELEKTDHVIYSNVHLKTVDYLPITSVQHLLSLKEKKNLFIVFDEIFTLLNDKTIPRDIRDDMMEFLSQQRKMKNIFFTTAQEWLNIPIEFRRFVRVQIECETIPLGRFGGILIEDYYDARKMEWSNIHNEYVAPRIRMKWSKYEKRYMLGYDTYQRIRRLKRTEVPR